MTTLSDPMIQQVSRLFAALGDVSRLKILRALLEAGAPLSQGAAARAAGLSQANSSKHLAHLVQAGLATRKQQGNLVLFSPAAPLVSGLCDLVCGHVAQQAQDAYRSLH